MFLAITCKLQHRSNFTDELALLRGAIEYLQMFGYIYPYVFELQPEGLHLMHVHLCLQTEYIDYKELHTTMKLYDINCDLHSLPECELRDWLPYCIKNKGDLAFDYAESTCNEYARISLFSCKVSAQQICSLCGEVNGATCGTYKCWIK